MGRTQGREMARRSKSDSWALVIVFGIALALLAVAAPFLIAGWCIFNELRARNRVYQQSLEELVHPQERADITGYDSEVDRIEARMALLHATGISKGIPLRTDGLFDGRNTAGRDLNFELERLADEKQRLTGRRESVQVQLGQRLNRWVRARSQLSGARAGVLVFVAGFLIVAISGGDAGAIFDFMDPTSSEDRMAASIVGALAAAITIPVVTLLRRASLRHAI
jgi:hypothetical protein